MVNAMDFEDMVLLGIANKTCLYYAEQTVVTYAQLVILPCTSLCSHLSQEILGLELHSNTLVLTDDVQNLPSVIANLIVVTLALGLTEGSCYQLDKYLHKYVDRLSLHHIFMGDLQRLVHGLIASMTTDGSRSR